jgi:hypothetical protein
MFDVCSGKQQPHIAPAIFATLAVDALIALTSQCTKRFLLSLFNFIIPKMNASSNVQGLGSRIAD